MKLPLAESNQYAPAGFLPAGKIALRSFKETPTTRERKRNRISSEKFEPMKCRGDRWPSIPLSPLPTPVTSGSATQLRVLRVRLSNHSLEMIPCIDGGAP